jgi:hypothetical protein
MTAPAASLSAGCGARLRDPVEPAAGRRTVAGKATPAGKTGLMALALMRPR